MAALFGIALASLTSTASAQTIFQANFDDYAGGQSLSGQTDPTYGGLWDTSDPDNGGTYTYGNSRTGFIGQTDDVDNVSGFSSTNLSDQSATVGGNFAPGVVPGVPTVTVDHMINFGAAATASFNLDFLVTSSSGSFPARDSFGIQFGTGSGTTASSLFAINFTPSLDGTATDNIGYNVGVSSNTATGNFNLNSKYHLAVNVNLVQQNFTGTLSIIAADGTTTGSTVVTRDANGNMGATAYTGTISDFALLWKLTNSNVTSPGTNGTTAYTAPGSNFLAVDNLVVAVPEPSAYAIVGLGLVGLAVGVRRRSQKA